MKAMETGARAAGAGVLKLYVRSGNERARRFYELAGFRVCGREPASHIAASVIYDSLEMAKALNPAFAIS